MNSLKIDGIIPPIPTPFVNGDVDHEKLRENVRKWNGTGIRGFLVLGSNGEYVYLSEAEKRAVVKTAVEAASEDKVILVGSGCESTIETIRLTRECAGLGAHAALVVTPGYYGGKMSPIALTAHFTAVADASPIPILLYNVPKFTHVDLPVEALVRLAAHPNIVGVKDSTGNVARLGEILEKRGKDFQVLVGTAGALYPALGLGCDGGILALACAAPEACVAIYDLFRGGQYEAARDLHLKMLPVNQAVTATYGIAGLKAAMEMRGYFGGDPRSPLLPLTQQERAALREIVVRAGLIP